MRGQKACSAQALQAPRSAVADRYGRNTKVTSLSHETSRNARTFFVVSPYMLDSTGPPKARIPEDCPLRRPGGPPCVVRDHHRRKRKTGPGFPLTVVRCHSHRKAFTLYPPGFAPYQRKPVFPLAPEGGAVIHEKSEEPLEAFAGTLFEAALDARKGTAWARNSDEGIEERWWATQGRHLDLASRLLGLAPAIGDRVRETIGAVLSVACMLLRERSRTAHQGYRSRGRAVCDVLQAMSWGDQRAIRLLFCGYVAGLWARPWTWDPSRRCLESLPFPGPGTTAPT